MRIKKFAFLFICLLTGWIVFAQFGMKFRNPDKKAKKIFDEAGVSLFTETIDANGYRLHYAKTGKDSLPTLLFVHGTPGSWMKFRKYLMDKDLLKKYRMVSVDRPGFGYSQFGDTRDLRQQSETISVLLKQLQNGKPVYAAGHSYGGSLVVRLAVDNPGRFSGLVLIAAALDPATEKKYFWRPLLSKIPLKYLVPGAWRPSNKELIYFKKDLEEMAEKVSVINCPVHILHGDVDDLVPVSNAEYGKKILANAKPLHVTILPGAHHHISDDHYELVKELLLNKLN
jgi:pimeloyl-ACP methyl ester carboxylesterase